MIRNQNKSLPGNFRPILWDDEFEFVEYDSHLPSIEWDIDHGRTTAASPWFRDDVVVRCEDVLLATLFKRVSKRERERANEWAKQKASREWGERQRFPSLGREQVWDPPGAQCPGCQATSGFLISSRLVIRCTHCGYKEQGRIVG